MKTEQIQRPGEYRQKQPLAPRMRSERPRPGLIFCRVVFGLLLPVTGYASNGELAVDAECIDGSPQGRYVVKTSSGLARIEGSYAAGVKTGDFTFYTPAGGKLIVIPYAKGFINGTVKAWYPGATKPKLISDIRGGLVEGRYQTWYENGNPRSNFSVKDGEIEHAEIWNTDGSAMAIEAKADFLESDIESDFDYYRKLEQVLDSFPPQC